MGLSVTIMVFEPTLGRLNTLRVTQLDESGALLDGGTLGAISLPIDEVAEGTEIGDDLEVFFLGEYRGQLRATSTVPIAMAGEYAVLTVAEANRVGVFLDWGLPKNLLLPFREQTKRVQAGDRVLVQVRADPVSQRLIASTKIRESLDKTAPHSVRAGDRVSLLIAKPSDLGTNAIVNHRFWGLLPASITNVPEFGTQCQGYIGRVQGDGLVDLTLENPGTKSDAADRVATKLGSTPDGFLALHDKSSPEEIRELLGMSKKVFKQAIGTLYRERRIRIEHDGITLIKEGS